VTARVKLTSHLFDGATTDTSSALLKGGSGRLWAAPGKLRIELQADNGDVQIVVANGKGYVYDGPADTTYTFTLPAHSAADKTGAPDAVPTMADIEKHIAEAQKHATIAGPQPDVVAGQPAYSVRLTPVDQGGLLGAAQVAWDAVRGAPLRVALYARGSSTPALELAVTDISYGSVDPGVFDLTPPATAKTVDLTGSKDGADKPAGGPEPTLSNLPFTVVQPAALGQRQRSEVKPTGNGGALVLYGKGLDTIAVLEHKAGAKDKPAATGSRDGQAIELPTVQINGAKATAFGTPLGGVVMFERDGVSYTVAGSQPLDVLEAAARAL
jgi:hypothetical protein